ncbi:MAG: nucleotidyltransferase family protein [Nanoarchaeota archaeon]
MGTNPLLNEIRQKIIPLLKEHNVTKAGIFGSYARGEQDNKSDVDILVEIGGGTDLIELIRLRAKLQNMIKRKVDLVEYGSIRSEIRNSILRDEFRIL